MRCRSLPTGQDRRRLHPGAGLRMIRGVRGRVLLDCRWIKQKGRRGKRQPVHNLYQNLRNLQLHRRMARRSARMAAGSASIKGSAPGRISATAASVHALCHRRIHPTAMSDCNQRQYVFPQLTGVMGP